MYIFLLRNITKNQANYTKHSSKKEGDVSIEKMPKKNKSKSDKLGDYVDMKKSTKINIAKHITVIIFFIITAVLFFSPVLKRKKNSSE